MKKICCIFLCGLLVLALGLPVSAIGNSQILDLTGLGDNILVFKAQEPPAFWECPTLKAGEYTERAGRFIIRNKTNSKQKIGLQSVVLPYENEDALRYLNHLTLTLKSGDTVLYEGPYSRINDNGGLALNTEIPANGNIFYTIDLKCDFAYSGNGFAENDKINWQFYAVVEPAEPVAVPFSDSALYEVILACGIAAIVLAGIFIYDYFWKKRNQ